MRLPHQTTLVLALSLSLFAQTVSAADGVVEINQACATNNGCFSGDTAGFPVTIDGSGGRSYVLTSDLTVSVVNVSAIDIISGWAATIDLNGFAISGPISCTGSGSGVICPDDSSAGVQGGGGVRVGNGHIRGFGYGVNLGERAEISNVHTSGNSRVGISTESGAHGIVRDSTAVRNGGVGILVRGGSVTGSTASANGAGGILINLEPSVLVGNSAIGNGRWGVHGTSGSVIRETVARANDWSGIVCSGNCVIEGCTADGNLEQAGISAGDGALVSGNVVSSNAGNGIDVGVRSVVRGNAIRNSGENGIESTGTVSVEGNQVAWSGGDGVSVGPNSNVSGNSIHNSTGNGVVVGDASLIDRNTVNFNGADGVVAGAGSKVSENTLRSNTNAINGGSTVVYMRNVLSANGAAATGGATSAGDNFCSGVSC